MTTVSNRRPPRPIRRMALPEPHVVSRHNWNFMDVFIGGLIITGLITAVLLGAAALLGSLWLVLWVARQVVGLLA